MKLLHEASLRIQLHQMDDGSLVLGANLIADDLDPTSNHASADSIAAAAAYALFVDGTVHAKARELFNVDLGSRKNGAQEGNGSSAEVGTGGAPGERQDS
jgi:hypothetical protein